jgi:hypothetical protein
MLQQSAVTKQPAATPKPLWKRTWFIVTAAVVGVLAIGGVANGLNRNSTADPIANTSSEATTSAAPSTTPTSSPTTSASSDPVAAAVDPAFFKSSAAKNLDDFEKDLNDLTDAMAKASQLRVLSNSVELSFNSGQLGGTKAPSSVASEWEAATATLADLTKKISDAGGNEDYTTLTSLVAAAHGHITAMRDIAARAA